MFKTSWYAQKEVICTKRIIILNIHSVYLNQNKNSCFIITTVLQREKERKKESKEKGYKVAKTHWMTFLYRSFPAKEPYTKWLFCGKWPEKKITASYGASPPFTIHCADMLRAIGHRIRELPFSISTTYIYVWKKKNYHITYEGDLVATCYKVCVCV